MKMIRPVARARCVAWVLLATGAAHAQSGGPYAIVRSTIDAGGGVSTGAPYALTGTVGQADAWYSDGAPYAVRGGFWGSRGNPPSDSIFDNGFD